MPESLLAWFSRYLDGPDNVLRRLAGRPVLVYEPLELPPANPGDSIDDFEFRTQSGLELNAIGGGDPLAVVVEKTKDNAFKQRVSIGRTSNNDIVLDDASVSRFHAWLQQEEDTGAWCVVDAGSRNGTTLAGKRLPAKKAVRLSDGQAVKVGAISLVFYSPNGFLAFLKKRASA